MGLLSLNHDPTNKYGLMYRFEKSVEKLRLIECLQF